MPPVRDGGTLLPGQSARQAKLPRHEQTRYQKIAQRHSLVPHWSEERGVETCDTGVSAFERHSVIAFELRQSGWTLVAYTAGRHHRSVCPPDQHRSTAVSAFSLLFNQPRTERAS